MSEAELRQTIEAPDPDARDDPAGHSQLVVTRASTVVVRVVSQVSEEPEPPAACALLGQRYSVLVRALTVVVVVVVRVQVGLPAVGLPLAPLGHE